MECDMPDLYFAYNSFWTSSDLSERAQRTELVDQHDTACNTNLIKIDNLQKYFAMKWIFNKMQGLKISGCTLTNMAIDLCLQ
jgi:hypothetical protein